jgi:hypothetical protein
LCPRISIGGPQKTMRSVMAEINTAELPDELVDVEIMTKVF